MIFFLYAACYRCICRYDTNQYKSDHSCRECNPEVFVKFIFHSAALSVARCDRCIRYKRQVITKHSATHNRSNAKRHTKSRCFRYSRCDRCQKCNCPNRSSHCNRYKTGNHKQNHNCVFCRNHLQHKICHTFRTASSDNTDKNTGSQKDQEHCNDIFICQSFRHNF